MTNNSPLVLCTTVLVETSPQALPLGAACIASALKQKIHKTTHIELQSFSLEDRDIKGLSPEKAGAILAKKIAEKNPSIVCFSIYVWNRFVLAETAKKLRDLLPKAVFIAGGTEVTASPTSFIKDSKNPFDFLVSGEGEDCVSNLVVDILTNKALPKDKILFSKHCNLEELPSPYLDGTLDTTKYDGALWELARGCPFSCSYCYESKGEKKVRYFSKKRLYEELDYFVKTGVKQVFVLDPTYNIDKNRALDMLHYIEKNAPDIFFHFECRPEYIDKKLANAFSQISCSLQIGLQSSNEKVLKNVQRTFNKKDFINNVGLLNETGAVFGFDLIYGLPGDNLEGFKNSINFALELYPNHLEVFQLSVLPGTSLFDKAKEFGLDFMQKAPYHVHSSPSFPKHDIEKAKKLAFACSLFYTQGRAVPWFLALIKPLNKKPTTFLEEFSQFLSFTGLREQDLSFDKCNFPKIVQLQKDFIKEQYVKKNCKHLMRFACDVIDLNAAISSYIADGQESTVEVNYHPDDLLSPYSQDPKYFVQHAERFPCTVEVSQQVVDETGDLYTIVY